MVVSRKAWVGFVLFFAVAWGQAADEDYRPYTEQPRLFLRAQRLRLLKRERDRQSMRWEQFNTLMAGKAQMAELSDAVIALPGGYGTFEELFEAITWSQLGIHTKAIGLLNVSGFYDGLLNLVDHAIDEGFVPPEHRALVLQASEPEVLLDLIVGYEPPPPVRKWLKPDEI